jgi:NAD-dependent SIR2 family protein deacetylase
MSWSARDEAGAKEFFDSEEAMKAKMATVAQALRRSKHAIVFTGAGLSTSAGIPDFRSGVKTVLKTGPGLWAAQADYEKRNPVRSEETKNDPKRPRVDLDEMLKKEPTFSHKAIAKLVEVGMVKSVMTQNVDNLHRRSGVNRKCMIELHGNLMVERCDRCGRDYERDFRIGPNPGMQHYTGRKCDCGGSLKDYLVPFGEDLPKKETDRAWRESEAADFCLVLGSSLTVTPACDYAGWVASSTKQRFYNTRSNKYQGTLAIINIQKTPYDQDASPAIYSFCDDAMRELMSQLGLEVSEQTESCNMRDTDLPPMWGA